MKKKKKKKDELSKGCIKKSSESKKPSTVDGFFECNDSYAKEQIGE